ncbi:hypothetical protein GW17_00047903 [Ensete ventricosum]|nr:hypothetical protein GW17_00047903 [Ensete ventricosum]RZR78441.1 hypothetical protein BHM03_00003774 [Ensete ventricosum]
MARPSAGVAGHDQAPYRGGQPHPSHLQGGSRLWPRPPAKGRSAVAKAPCKGVAGCCQGQPGAIASGQPTRGSPNSQGCRQQEQWRRPQEQLLAGKLSRRLHRGGGDGTERARGVRAILL